jgi:flagellar hook-basal body complex protein FliE
MTITPIPALQPLAAPSDAAPMGSPSDDAPLSAAGTGANDVAPAGFATLLTALNDGAAQLERAEGAENAFIAGTGSLQEMVFERAKADSLVSIAAATSSHVVQSLNTISQMQL